MKEKENQKKNNIKRLVILYLNYAFSKPNIIIFLISLLSMALLLVLISNPWQENIDYLVVYKDSHDNYLTLSLFVIQAFNSVMIASITISIIITSVSFDFLFISYVKRKEICVSKIISILIIVLFLSIFEFTILELVGIFRFSLFKFDYIDLLLILYLFLVSVFEGAISFLLSTLFKQVFVPLTIVFLSITFKIISTSVKDFKYMISYISPFINVKNQAFSCDGLIQGVVVTFILFILYSSLYNVKDLKL